jgi:hypothetical protein
MDSVAQNKARGASDGIKPEAPAPGSVVKNALVPAKRPTAQNNNALSPVSRAPNTCWAVILGLAPQALCCRPLRGLRACWDIYPWGWRAPGFMLPPASRAPRLLGYLSVGLAPQALCCRPLRGLKRFSIVILGLAPQALCCRPLRGLGSVSTGSGSDLVSDQHS